MRRSLAHAGQASASVAIDTMLSPVLGVFGVADVTQLPAAVLSKYESVKETLLNVPGMTPDQLASAMGPAVVNAGLAVFQGNPAAGVKMLYNAMLGVMAVAGGPIGAAVAGALDATQSILGAIGGYAHGAGDECQSCSQGGSIWYGGWDISQHKAPIHSTLPGSTTPDPRWIKWDNQTTHGPYVVGSDGKNDGQCADDMPTVQMSRWVCSQGQNTGLVSGNFLDLTSMLKGVEVRRYTGGLVFTGNVGLIEMVLAAGQKHTTTLVSPPQDGFDYAFAQQLAMLLEQYMNAQGPRPVTGGTQQTGPNQWSSIPSGPGEINLRDVIENMVYGWNAIHQPGKPVQLNRPYPVPKSTGGYYTGPNNTGFYVATTAPVPPGPNTDHNFWDPGYVPGDYARRYLLADPRSQDVPLMLNTGPLLQGIQDLFNMRPPAPTMKIEALRPGGGGKSSPAYAAAMRWPVCSAQRERLLAAAGLPDDCPTKPTAGVHLLPIKVAMPVKVAMPAQPPPRPAPSYVGLTALIGTGAALAFGLSWVALGALGVGAIVGAYEAWRAG